MERIRRLRNLDDNHDFTLVCRDLSDISTYARVDNQAYRLLKMLTPGPYTFILGASREVPRRLQNPKRKTIGIRVPDQPVVRMLLDELAEPLMSVTLIMPGSDLPLTDPEEMRDLIGRQVDAIIDGGSCGCEPTSVIDLTDECRRCAGRGRETPRFWRRCEGRRRSGPRESSTPGNITLDYPTTHLPALAGSPWRNRWRAAAPCFGREAPANATTGPDCRRFGVAGYSFSGQGAACAPTVLKRNTRHRSPVLLIRPEPLPHRRWFPANTSL